MDVTGEFRFEFFFAPKRECDTVSETLRENYGEWVA